MWSTYSAAHNGAIFTFIIQLGTFLFTLLFTSGQFTVNDLLVFISADLL